MKNLNIKKLIAVRNGRKSKVKDGIDIYEEDRLVSFNPEHENYIDTNNPYDPKPIYNTIDGCTCISVFLRKETDDRYDGNPLIYALKNFEKVVEYEKNRGKNDKEKEKEKEYRKLWKFKNKTPDINATADVYAKSDIYALLKRFVAVTKEFKEPFDTIILVPSSSKLNTYVAECISKIKKRPIIKRFFYKLTVNEVEENGYLDEDKIIEEYPENEQDAKRAELREALSRMRKLNKGMFSYKYFHDTKLRKCVSKSMDIYQDIDGNDISEKINDKRILVVDDTITSKGTLSETAQALNNETFHPKEIIFFTLFSSKNNE